MASPRTISTLTQLRSRIRADLGMTDSSLFTDSDLNDWLYEGQTEIAKEALWYRLDATAGTTAGTKEYTLPDDSNGQAIQIEEISYDDRQLIPVTIDQLLAWDRYYRTAGNGTPEWYYLRGNTGFGLHYTPSVTDVDILRVVYVAIPPKVTDANTKLYVPSGNDKALIIYAKVLASEKDAHGEGARRLASYQSQWSMELAKIKKQVGGVAERIPTVMGQDAEDWQGLSGRVPFYTNISEVLP